jgi:hypothetical protein
MTANENDRLPAAKAQRIGSREDEPERYGYVNGWNAYREAAIAALAAPEGPPWHRPMASMTCPSCNGSQRRSLATMKSATWTEAAFRTSRKRAVCWCRRQYRRHAAKNAGAPSTGISRQRATGNRLA